MSGDVIALIPARGGSKGLPGKNIRLLSGKPLICWTIAAAQACVAQVFVSTDCEEIATISRQAGANVPFLRPAGLAGDTSSSLDVVRHFLDWYRQTYGQNPDTVMLLQPTSPLRTSGDLLRALTRYRQLPQPASLVSVCPDKPVNWQGTIAESGEFVVHQYIQPDSNRQSEPVNYRLNGAIYIASPQRYLNGELMAAPVYPYVMPVERSVDIDTPADFLYAQTLMESRHSPEAQGDDVSVSNR